MQRSTILVVCALFCVIAVAAGYFVAGMSGSSSAQITAQGVTPTIAAVPAVAAATAAATEVPVASATSAPTAPEATAAATAAPAATDAPTTIPTDVPAATSVPTNVPAPTAASATAAPVGFVEYTVQRGDELQAIAKKYGVTVKDIIANNDIPNPDSLRVSQVLRIPSK